MAKLKEAREFSIGDAVVYPSHGVGQITAEEVEVIGGIQMHLYVITFAEDRMTLRVPKSGVTRAGLRKISSADECAEALGVLQTRTRGAKAGMWSKRAQDYRTKLNSGNLVEIAKVLRDLYRPSGETERSFSERKFCEDALDKLTAEYAMSAVLSKDEARNKIISMLEASSI